MHGSHRNLDPQLFGQDKRFDFVKRNFDEEIEWVFQGMDWLFQQRDLLCIDCFLETL